MGACACAAKNPVHKSQQNQITAEDQMAIQRQIQVVVEQPEAILEALSKTLSMKKLLSVKQKSNTQNNEDVLFQNWYSLISNKDGNMYMGQKSYSQNSKTGTSNQSNTIDFEQKQREQQQQIGLLRKTQKQTAKNRNWVFNRSSMLGQGLKQEDNLSIQSTLDADAPVELQAIQLKVGVTYQGQWKNAMRHGQGIQIWEDASKYQGQWEYNQQNGHGIIEYSDGDIYQGTWKDDSYHGHGKYTCKNGHFYEGQWHQGKKEGRGTQKWEDGQIYFGNFKGGLKHGRGLIKFKDGSYYDGQFSCNQINGKGKYVWKNNRQYDGDWIKNEMCGFGILKWADGRHYQGLFSNDKREGKGQMYYIDGTRYKGDWRQGKQDGHGQIFEGAKLKYSGPWKDGKKVKNNNKRQSTQTFSR